MLFSLEQNEHTIFNCEKVIEKRLGSTGSRGFLRLYKILCPVSQTPSLFVPTITNPLSSTTLVQKVARSASASENYLRNLQPLFFPPSADSLFHPTERRFPSSHSKVESESESRNAPHPTRVATVLHGVNF